MFSIGKMWLLLTLIGVSGSQVTALEEKMAGNIRDENLAFQAAETALRTGEAIVMLNPPAFSVGGNGTGGTGLYTTVGTGVHSSYWQTVDWNNNAAVATYAGGSLNHVNSAPAILLKKYRSQTQQVLRPIPAAVWNPERLAVLKPSPGIGLQLAAQVAVIML